MIQHAWAVLCEKSIIDRDTNNISLDVIEQLEVVPEVAPPEGTLVMVPAPVRLVNLWWRDDARPSTATVRTTVVDPNGNELGHMDVDLMFPEDTSVRRVRTVQQFVAIPATVSGIYRYVVSLRPTDGPPRDVAVVPLQISMAPAARAPT